MDSMRSLNTSLPSAPTEPPEELLSAFKTAALSVTSLYRTSVAGQAHARREGYQEALEEVRGFLDREGLALDGFDGAKLRRWLDERIEGGGGASASGEWAERRAQGERTTGSGASQQQQQQSQQQQQQQYAPPSSNDTSPPAFTFSAGPSFPSYPPKDHPDDLTMQLDAADHPARPHLTPASVFHPDNLPSSFASSSSSSTPSSIYPQQSTTPPTSSTTATVATATIAPQFPLRAPRAGDGAALGVGMNLNLGSKRKHGFGDFFDIANFGGVGGKDGVGSAGGKRGRFI